MILQRGDSLKSSLDHDIRNQPCAIYVIKILITPHSFTLMHHLKIKVKLLRHRLRLMRGNFDRFIHRSNTAIRFGGGVLSTLAFIGAIVCIVCFTVYTGFNHSEQEFTEIRRILRWVQGVFIVRIVYDLVLRFKSSVKKAGLVRWIVDAVMLLTLLPWIYPRPAHPWIAWLDAFLYSRPFLFSALAAYSGVTLCFGIIKAVGKRTNPSLLLSGSFLVVIMIGSMLLMLPNSTYGGISYADAFFVSTSAVCITGLTPVDIYTTFTPMGVIILAILIQIGGLGVMTFTSFFALFFSGSTSIYSQLLLKDMIYSRSMSALVPTLLYILGFTIAVEAIGSVFIMISIHNTLGMTWNQEIAFAMFHSLSAFCNAGFSTLPGGLSNPQLLYSNISIYWVMSALIVAGSIGFPILVNFRDALADRMKRMWLRLRHRQCGARNVHLYNMNTKIVLVTFFTLLGAGTLLFRILEADNSLAGHPGYWQWTQAVFNSVTPRSAGFTSVNPAGFLNVTLIMVLFLMWVGGASQSTGGGVKVNTLAAIILNLKATVTGRERVTVFSRTVSVWSLRRANAVVAISILAYLVYAMALLWLEPELPAKALLFEACSALFTVGSSLGVTPSLNQGSEWLLCTAMFLGRVGIISLLTGLAGRRHEVPAKFPSDNIIIN